MPEFSRAPLLHAFGERRIAKVSNWGSLVPGMNLATIFSVILWMACASSPATGGRAIVPGHASVPVNPSASQAAGNTETSQQPSAQTPPVSNAPAAKTQTPNSKRRTHKRKKPTDASKCANNTASSKAAGNASANAAGANPPTPTNCPPSKTVVQNGGTSEPAVQITGGEGAAQAQQRSTTDQLLGSTEDNLKKIAGRELTSAQKDMVSQVRQYMEQSKEAVTAGDAERGRMLAQKAQLLSDELVKP